MIGFSVRCERLLKMPAVQSRRLPLFNLMKRKPLPILWMVTAFAVAMSLAVAVLALEGTDTKAIVMALRITARWAFMLFWLAYAGGAIATLFGPVFAPIARRGRELGLAYASAMLIHIGLVVWLFQISPTPPLSGRGFNFFVTGIVFTYLLAVFSVDWLAASLGPTGWRVLRFVGTNYILYAFATDFVNPVIRPPMGQHGLLIQVAYMPFALMCFAGPLLVLAATARRLGARYRGSELRPVAN